MTMTIMMSVMIVIMMNVEYHHDCDDDDCDDDYDYDDDGYDYDDYDDDGYDDGIVGSIVQVFEVATNTAACPRPLPPTP